MYMAVRSDFNTYSYTCCTPYRPSHVRDDGINHYHHLALDQNGRGSFVRRAQDTDPKSIIHGIINKHRYRRLHTFFLKEYIIQNMSFENGGISFGRELRSEIITYTVRGAVGGKEGASAEKKTARRNPHVAVRYFIFFFQLIP